MAVRRKNFSFRIDRDITSGFDVGSYPKHRFVVSGAGRAENIPVAIVKTGPDEWVQHCFREREKSGIYALELVTEGTFRFTQNKQSYELTPGEIFIVRREQSSSMECLSATGCKRAVILDGALLNQIMSNLGLAERDCILNGRRDRMEELFQQAEKICAGGSLAANSAFTYSLLLELSGIPQQNAFSPKLRRAMEYLQANLNRQVPVSELCQHCASSPASIAAMFSRELHMTPRKYHEQLRLDYAGDLLERLHESVKEVSFMLGFSSPQYFATRFKNFFGCVPGDVASGKVPLFRLKHTESCK